ncbi:MAG: hypothetical protein US66_C0031G0003 [Candidatus Moranbacteria bacterium GW2011_GWD2_37_9]|nr:MAG: hypothetical protein US66_C0031G0003 [Candidatus Moranbacteria bacterium GW2011_GWD2_37_9]
MGAITKRDGGGNGTEVIIHRDITFSLTGTPIPKDKRRYVREIIPKKKNPEKTISDKK